MNIENFSDVFIVKSHFNNKNLIYAPLRRRLFWANDIAAEQIYNCLNSKADINEELNDTIKDYVQELVSTPPVSVAPEDIKDRGKAVILLTQKCNLACPYCYAVNAHCKDTISFEYIKTIVDHVLYDKKENKSFTFIGGGEPTVEWELFVKSIDYIKISATSNQKIKIGLTTNGTLLNTNRISWLRDNNIRVGLSFDILPDVQKNNRPFPNKQNSFDIVDITISNMLSQGVIPNIRSTITEYNVSRMQEMVEYVIDHYPGIDTLHFEHVSLNGNNSRQYYSDFVNNFFSAKKIAQKNGITLKNSITTSMKALRYNFCNGEFCITPNGEIVACHRVSSNNDMYFDEFHYGSLLNDRVAIDYERLNNFYKYSRKIESRCDKCFARWNCAGTCTYNKKLYFSNNFDYYCDFVKDMVISELECLLNLS